MHRLARLTLVAFALLLIADCSTLRAQQAIAPFTRSNFTRIRVTGSNSGRTDASRIDTAAVRQNRSATDTTAFHMTKSPLEAVLLSAVVPGLGQAYLDQYWKLPFVYGLLGAFFYGEQIQNVRYHYTSDTINNAYARANARDTLWALQNVPVREFYRDDRDKFWIYIGLTYVATILDAYIAANLYDFDVSDPAPTSPPTSSSTPAPKKEAPVVGAYFDPNAKTVGLTFSMRF